MLNIDPTEGQEWIQKKFFIFSSRKPSFKVKLFVGFDYECPRGHRFFVDAGGEPLVLPKVKHFNSPFTLCPCQGHSAREQACRDAGQNIMGADLPLRRQCTCRKMPNQVAQLMKIHIVTPKSPVSVTIDPKIFIPNQEGYYCTGEPPLKLAWAKFVLFLQADKIFFQILYFTLAVYL